MILLEAERVALAVAEAGLTEISSAQAERLAAYGNLIFKWNARTNLTSIRDAETLLQRHLVESIAAAQALPEGVGTLLDYGSGAGLPGIPIALCRSGIMVTLAESQSKKAAFLLEARRLLGLECIVFSGRVSDMPGNARFDVVILRAVDKMEAATGDAITRVAEGGWLAVFRTDSQEEPVIGKRVVKVKLPTIGHLALIQDPLVPRGTPD